MPPVLSLFRRPSSRWSAATLSHLWTLECGVRAAIGSFLPLLQRLECQLLLGSGGFDLGDLATLRQDPPISSAAKALRILQGRAGPLEYWHRAPIRARLQTAMEQAARDGVLELVRGLHEQGCPWDVWTCRFAAVGGHLEVLQWAREHGCPWDEQTCSMAAKGGHLEVLQWAREHGCPWNEGTCQAAAGGGHLEVLQWARDQACPWDATVCREAAKGGHLEVVQWAREHGCP